MLLIYLIGTLKWVEFDVSINSSYWWHDFKKRTKSYCQMQQLAKEIRIFTTLANKPNIYGRKF